MSKSDVEVLSAQDLVDQEKGAIYVLNTSSQSELGLGGDVFVTVMVGNQNRAVKIPRTWIPVEVTKSIPRKFLMESPNFLEAMAKGFITAISTESAKKILGKPGATQEERRLIEIDNAIREASKVRGVGKNVTVSSGRETEGEEEGNAPVKRKNVTVVSVRDMDNEAEEAQPTVSQGFVAWVNKLNAMNDEKAARNEIRVRGELEEEEAHYLMEKTSYDKIRASLARTLGRD